MLKYFPIRHIIAPNPNGMIFEQLLGQLQEMSIPLVPLSGEAKPFEMPFSTPLNL